jgi:hypothetical protein
MSNDKLTTYPLQICRKYIQSFINISSFSINVRLGTKKAALTVDPHVSLSSYAITFALSFSAEQRLFLKITTLEDTITHDMFGFIRDPNDPYGTVIPATEVKKMKRDRICTFGHYILLKQIDDLHFMDLRRASLSQLTDEEMQQIRKEFNQLDVDNSGTISLEGIIRVHLILKSIEVEKFFHQEVENEIKQARKIADRRIKIKPLFK